MSQAGTPASKHCSPNMGTEMSFLHDSCLIKGQWSLNGEPGALRSLPVFTHSHLKALLPFAFNNSSLIGPMFRFLPLPGMPGEMRTGKVSFQANRCYNNGWQFHENRVPFCWLFFRTFAESWLAVRNCWLHWCSTSSNSWGNLFFLNATWVNVLWMGVRKQLPWLQPNTDSHKAESGLCKVHFQGPNRR